MAPSDEQRREARIPNNVRFFVHVHECEEDPDLVGTSVTCEAVDMSLHGLQFKTDQRLYDASLVNITIGVGNPFAMFLLRGEIRWVKEEGVEYAVGILLKDAELTDFDKWVDRFESIFA